MCQFTVFFAKGKFIYTHITRCIIIIIIYNIIKRKKKRKKLNEK